MGFPGGTSGRCRRRNRQGSVPGLGRSPGGGHGNPLQHSCLENPMDRGVWQAMAQRVALSQIQLKQLSTDACKRIGYSILLHVGNYSLKN